MTLNGARLLGHPVFFRAHFR